MFLKRRYRRRGVGPPKNPEMTGAPRVRADKSRRAYPKSRLVSAGNGFCKTVAAFLTRACCKNLNTMDTTEMFRSKDNVVFAVRRNATTIEEGHATGVGVTV